MAAQSPSHNVSPLRQALDEISERVERYRAEQMGEQNTKATLIVPVLRALGWNVEDLDEVHLEYRGVPVDKPVDYALLLQRKPVLFIEAKALGGNLADRKWASQIVSYAAVAGVEWVVLTNGDEYRIYNALSEHDVEDKLFRSVRVSGDLAEAEDALRLLTKDELRKKSLAALWRAQSIDTKVRRAVAALFEPEPDPWLVRRLAKSTEGLTPGDVRGALQRARITLDLPPPELAAEAVPPLDEPRPRAEPRPSVEAKQQRASGRPASYAVTVKDLLDARLIRPGATLRKTYLGTEVKATIEADGHIRVGADIYNSLSVAAAVARVSVKGPPSDGRPYYQTNGWTFWEYEDEAGQRHVIQKLRERYLAERSDARAG
jgi:Restriction Enzyme Adenine Methylase Associated/Type I restriction enzyme R protein N terminus (HSDR_N)